eukprot:scaffold95244_cov26-Tisochrysis_lutea.AAC.6
MYVTHTHNGEDDVQYGEGIRQEWDTELFGYTHQTGAAHAILEGVGANERSVATERQLMEAAGGEAESAVVLRGEVGRDRCEGVVVQMVEPHRR